MNKPKDQGKALVRLSNVENQLKMIGQVLNQALQQLAGKLGEHDKVLRALTETIGEDEVNAVINSHRIAELEKQKEQSKSVVAKLVEKGIASKLDTVQDQTSPTSKVLLVLHENGPDGVLKEPGYAAMFLEQFTDDFRKQLLGQSVGFSFKDPSGISVTVDEIYLIDQEKERQLAEEEQLAAQTAAAAAAPPPAAPEEPAAPVAEVQPKTES